MRRNNGLDRIKSHYKYLVESSGKAEVQYMYANQRRLLSEIHDCSSDFVAISGNQLENFKDQNT